MCGKTLAVETVTGNIQLLRIPDFFHNEVQQAGNAYTSYSAFSEVW